MNILFAMYGDFATNSAIPMALHARELTARGHDCVAAVASNVESAAHIVDPRFRAVLHAEALANPAALFRDQRAADIVHAWTTREGLRRFVTAYLAQHPTPWIVYLEDNEGWIARRALAMVGFRADVLLEHTEEVISTWTPEGLSHPLRYESFIGLADGAVVVQDKLAREVPPWVPCSTILPPVDLESFAPRAPDPALRERCGVRPGERVIVYPGGVNDFTRPGLEALCHAVLLVNSAGVPCRLLRSGPSPTPFVPPERTAAFVNDLGLLPRREMPGLLGLADVFVQPGEPNEFEDLRLPGKLPELLASGRPVVVPDSNIAHLLDDGVNALIHRTGSPEEIAQKCLAILSDPQLARRIGAAGRSFAEAHFDAARQAIRLEEVYRRTIAAFDERIAREIWTAEPEGMPMPAMLSRKLRLLGNPLLAAHAKCIDFTIERCRGLENGMAVRDREIAARDDRIAARETEIGELREQVGIARTEIGALRDGLESLRAASEERAATLHGTIAEREQRIAALESSLSWRMTRPFRAIAEILLHRGSKPRR